MKAPRDLTGRTFGRWTVVGYLETDRYYRRKWSCQCSCGNPGSVFGSALLSGASLSCGCLQREAVRAAHLRHGHAQRNTDSPEYTAWLHMRGRCGNPKEKFYKRYGGRGIRVCERWQNSFENFLADMGSRPPGMTLERKNNDGNYEPSNCVWASRDAQALNTSTVRKITFGGETLSLRGWAIRRGISRSTLQKRLDLGWTVDQALTVRPGVARLAPQAEAS